MAHCYLFIFCYNKYMKILKTIKDENTTLLFFEAPREKQSIGVLKIMNKTDFSAFIISKDNYFDYIKNNNEEDLVYMVDSYNEEFSELSGSLENDNLELERLGSLDQEYFDQPSFKTELAFFLKILPILCSTLNQVNPLKIDALNYKDIFFITKAIQRISVNSFKSLISNKEYNFVLDPKFSDEDVNNWLVNNNEFSVWIAPIKDYICFHRKKEEQLSPNELLDCYLIKQFATLLSIENASSEWMEGGYVQTISNYLDPIVQLK